MGLKLLDYKDLPARTTNGGCGLGRRGWFYAGRVNYELAPSDVEGGFDEVLT
jgi:hypothetical protein